MRNRDRHPADTEAAPSAGRKHPPAPEAQGDGEPTADEATAVEEASSPNRPSAKGETRTATSASSADPSDASTSAADGAGAAPLDLSRELAEQRDRYLRLAAEYDNFRKRTARERAESGSRAQAELVSRLIDALDDLSRFAHVDPAVTDSQTLHKGIELVEQKALKALDAAGLTIIYPLDQTFDPTLHEAVTTEQALAPEDDQTVAKVFQRGYMFNGQLLRPARVVVKQWNG